MNVLFVEKTRPSAMASQVQIPTYILMIIYLQVYIIVKV